MNHAIVIENDISSLERMIGAVLTLHGRVIVQSDNSSCLAESYEAFKDRQFVELEDNSTIAKSLMTMLPIYGGGDCLYDEECLVTGRLVDADGMKRIVDISTLNVTDEDGVQHQIIIR
jgi:hypothetical protein